MPEIAGDNCNSYRCSCFGLEVKGHCLPILMDNGFTWWTWHVRSGMPVSREPGWMCPFYEYREQTATA